MGTEVLKSFGTLQFELEQAKISLKDTDETIKRLIGRDPSENQSRPGGKRPGNLPDDARGRPRGHNNSNFNNNRNKQIYETEEPITKKRNLDSSVFKRLSDRVVDRDRSRHFEDDIPEALGKQQLISRVIVTPKEMPSRQDILAAQGADEKSKARNRRMFGALLGTLQKFRQEETKLKPKEEKRARVEKKLEEQQIRERDELKKERQSLFFNRKQKQAEIRMIELKMTRMKEQAEWEEKQGPLMNFILTKSKPHIYYLPKIHNDQSKTLLTTCQQNIEKIIDRKRQDIYEELDAIEQRMKRNFSQRQGANGTDKHNDGDEQVGNEETEDHDQPSNDHDIEQNNENNIERDTVEENELPISPDLIKVEKTDIVRPQDENNEVSAPAEISNSPCRDTETTIAKKENPVNVKITTKVEKDS